ncbi:bifunctional DNA-formamidopyrimidine glycosylase/DNA-(apurinic or apyrimidinic site) lyase [candidate division KSB1 bacterium]|nr:bifunctional DNA-formamidopyrimidine glycosylase/DNA-(apurinic or apyrimidinic site) lyase [candidate division KSB1 bacterium]
MPELPEVETIRRGIEPIIRGRRINAVHILQPDLRWKVDTKAVQKWVTGQIITAVSRRSKCLVWKLSNDASLVIHLGMSGRIGLFSPDEEVEKHTHLIFDLQGNIQLRYRDPRRFGYVDVVPPGSLSNYKRFSLLGPEPLSDEFNGSYLQQKLSKSKRAVKTALLDMGVAAGVGNIYASEALFLAGIDPRRLASDLRQNEFDGLAEAVKQVLSHAIKKGGTTLNDFRNATGEPGFFQTELAVYDRKEQPCLKCGTAIEKVVIGGRSTYFCPVCQG